MKNNILITTSEGKQSGKGTGLQSFQEATGGQHSPVHVLGLDWRSTPSGISGSQPRDPRCPCPLCCVYTENTVLLVISTKTDILHRENTSPLGFFSFIIGISWDYMWP